MQHYGSVEGFRDWASHPPQCPVELAIASHMAMLSHVESREWDMRRDMELVRTILRMIQEKPHLDYSTLTTIKGYDDLVVGRHVEMLFNAGYIDGRSSVQPGIGKPDTIKIKDLSWQGHEFYGAISTDEGTWQKVKDAFGPEKLATAPLKMIEAVATQALTAWAMGQMGLK